MKKILTLVALLAASTNAFAENRIISLGSSVTELFYALDATDKLVAIDVTSRYFDEEGKYPQVGYHRQLSAEGLIALNPTHIVGSSEMGPDSTIRLVKAAGIEVVTVPSGDSTEDLNARIETVAKLTNSEDKEAQVKADINARINELESSKDQANPAVMFAMLSEGRPATVAGSETTINKIIELAGANNPAKESFSSYKPMSLEAIVNLQPEYLLVSQRAWDSLGGHEGIIKHFSLLAATPAGINKKIMPVSSSALIGGFGIESVELSHELNQTFNQ